MTYYTYGTDQYFPQNFAIYFHQSKIIILIKRKTKGLACYNTHEPFLRKTKGTLLVFCACKLHMQFDAHAYLKGI